MSHLLLKKFATPFETVPFDQIKTDMFLPALKEAIKIGKDNVEAIKKNTERPSFKNVIEALENSGEEVERISGIFFNLNSAETNDEIQKLAKEISPLLTEFSNDISLDLDLFTKVKSVWENREEFHLDHEELMLLEKNYKGFVRNGANLNDVDKEKLREISKKLSSLSLQFSEHILKETQKYILLIEKEEDLDGLSPDVIEAASMTANEKGYAGKWVFTLDYPSFVPFLTYAKNRTLREKIYLANTTKAFKGDELDNQSIVLEIAHLRHEKAKLLGYESHAHFVLEERMASHPANVQNFLNNLLDHATPAAKKETEELVAYALKLDGIREFQKWDTLYYAEKLKSEKFQVSDEMLRPYFNLNKVIDGVFKIAQKLYGLHFKLRSDIPVYHSDVKTYEVTDEEGKHVAVFYADFHPRAGKRNGAWMTSFRGQKI